MFSSLASFFFYRLCDLRVETTGIEPSIFGINEITRQPFSSNAVNDVLSRLDRIFFIDMQA
jgi:hypothetical protein